jgi:hypothetical protein
MTAEQGAWFAEWWREYWRRVAKKSAAQAFRKHVRTESRFQEVMKATRAQKPEMLEREPEKRPHGATWLNQERWTDEPTSWATARRLFGSITRNGQRPGRPESTT